MKKILFSIFIATSFTSFGFYENVQSLNQDLNAAEYAYISGDYENAANFYQSAQTKNQGFLFPKDRHNMFITFIQAKKPMDEISYLIKIMRKEGFPESYFVKSHTINNMAKKANMDLSKIINQIYSEDLGLQSVPLFEEIIEKINDAEKQFQSKKISKDELQEIYSKSLISIEENIGNPYFYYSQTMGIPIVNDTTIDYSKYKMILDKIQTKFNGKEVVQINSHIIEKSLRQAFETGKLSLDMFLALQSNIEIEENFKFPQPVLYNNHYYVFLPDRENLENNRRKFGLSVTPQYLALIKYVINNPNTNFIHNVKLGLRPEKNQIKLDEYVKVE